MSIYLTLSSGYPALRIHRYPDNTTLLS